MGKSASSFVSVVLKLEIKTDIYSRAIKKRPLMKEQKEDINILMSSWLRESWGFPNFASIQKTMQLTFN